MSAPGPVTELLGFRPDTRIQERVGYDTVLGRCTLSGSGVRLPQSRSRSDTNNQQSIDVLPTRYLCICFSLGREKRMRTSVSEQQHSFLIKSRNR